MVTKGRKLEKISGGMDTASEDQEDLATMWEAWTPSKILGTRLIPQACLSWPRHQHWP